MKFLTFADKPFFVVLARDRNHLPEKIVELEKLRAPYIVVCGEHFDHKSVVYRAPRGKYDAINFASKEEKIPKDVKIIAFNDVDTKISEFEVMLRHFRNPKVAIVFASELVREGPQRMFFEVFNPLRRLLPLAASGELMMIRHEVLRKILPLKPCKAEDTYMMFKALELGYKVVFCDECFAETERTKTWAKEEIYKRKTVTGIYQALAYSRPPYVVRVFYVVLPFFTPLLLVSGRKGFFLMKGILLGFVDYVRGDRSGFWHTAYME